MSFRLLKGIWRGSSAKRRGEPQANGMMHPERYVESFFANTASRINTALRLAPRHFEAAKLLRELKELLEDFTGWHPRRA